MDCKTLTNDVMLDYSERALAADQRGQVDKHLNGCRGCRVRYEEVKRIAGGVRTTLQTPVHKALLDQLDAAVLGNLDKLMAQARPASNRRRIFWASSIAVAATLLIATIAWIATRGESPNNAGPIVKHDTEQPPTTTSTPVVPPVSPTTAPVPVPPKTDELTPEPPKTEQVPEPPPTATSAVAPPPPKTEEPPPPKTENPVIPDAPRTKNLPPVQPDVPKVDPPKPPVERAIVKGDFNKNGRVDAQDVAFLNDEILAGRTQDPALADVTGDGRVDCGDVLAMLQTIEKNS